jgi:hypothetical protein
LFCTSGAEPVHVDLGLEQGGLGGVEAGAGVAQLLAVGPVVDLEQGLPGPHEGAFLHENLFQVAFHLRPDLHVDAAFELAGKLLLGGGGLLRMVSTGRAGTSVPAAFSAAGALQPARAAPRARAPSSRFQGAAFGGAWWSDFFS